VVRAVNGRSRRPHRRLELVEQAIHDINIESMIDE
jgi:hypothetical protein